MDFDAPNIIAALVFSVIGLAYFRYGKKQAEPKIIFIGVALMGYSYVTPTLAWNIGVGVLLTLVPLVWR